ncbi:MAG: protein kinase [Thermoanaerobaculia bacterium]
MRLEAGARLGAFEILGPLGAGGMGEVYRALDSRLGREVAIKVLPEVHAQDARRGERLRREARAAGRINHPNVVTVYDVGEQEGLLYVVSELIEGRTLRSLIAEGPLGAGRALDLGRQLAAGLTAAHQQGVVHRDLKPENIVITPDGRVKILDFGIALLAADGRSESGAQGETETEAGALFGSSGYTSPEQARGEPVDPRTDLFALGAILFEVATGEAAFRGSGTVESLTAVLRDDPLERPVARSLPEDLGRVLRRCLAKSPAERFQSAEDLGFALTTARATAPGRAGSWSARALALAAGLAALAALGAWFVASRQPARTSTVAILPLKPIGAAAVATDVAHLGVGLADALITRLGAVDGLEVRPIGAVRRYADSEDPLAAGRALGVAAVLDGTIQRSGDRIRLRAQLLRVSDGSFLWSGTFEEDLAGIFTMEDELAVRMAEALRPALSTGERAALTRHEATDPVAFEHYLAGRYLWGRRDGESLKKAVAELELAVAREPGFARAHAALGDALAMLPDYAGKDLYDRARYHAEEALRLDPRLADAHLVLALIAHNHDLDWARADACYQRALAIEPNNAMGLHRYGEILVVWGAFDRGLEFLRRARELDPVSAVVGADLAKGYWFAGRNAEAEREARAVVQDEPAFALGHLYLGLSLMALGREAEGVAELRRNAELDSTPLSLGVLGWALAKSGDRISAEQVMAQIRGLSDHAVGKDFAQACILIGLEEDTAALDALARTVAGRVYVFGLDTSPVFEPLRGDPRFVALLRSVGLPYRPR